MNRFLFAGLCTLAAGLGSAGTADAQCLRCAGSPYGCGVLCMSMFPFMHKHGPLYNYSGTNGQCGDAGCCHGHGHGGHWGPWNHSAGCGGCGGHAWGGWLHGHSGHGCDACGSGGGHYARQTFANVFGRLHPTAHKCGQDCGLSCDSGCGHARGGWFGHHGCGGDGCGHAWGGWFGHHGCGGDGCGHGLLGHHGSGCGDGGCGGHGELFGLRTNLFCGGCKGGGGVGLATAPWYLYWPTLDNRFQVPGPNAAGWAGNHFVLPPPAPFGGYAGGGVNPYFPATAPAR